MKQRLPDPVMKALLLCAHADELSRQCVIAIRHQATEQLLDLQLRKNTIIGKLTSTSHEYVHADFPELERAVERLRAALGDEMRAVLDSAREAKESLGEVQAGQRRATGLRQYDRGAGAPLSAGSQLAICG